jgi:hypothetical protein
MEINLELLQRLPAEGAGAHMQNRCCLSAHGTKPTKR